VKETPDRQHLKELEELEEQLQHQKPETTWLPEEQRRAKAKAVGTRRQAGAATRLVGDKERDNQAAGQAVQQAARKAGKRLQQATKASRKG
jgi:glycine/D-amino acid oxidase-like deaminating enzyme